jgi:arabinofuranosyltransferase
MVVSGSEHPVTTDDWGKDPVPLDEGVGESTSGLYQADRRLEGRDGPLRTAPGGPTVVVIDHAVGLTSYLLPRDVYVLDGLGLGDAFTAHLELERRGLPGHEKALPPAWIWARFVAPDAPVVAGAVRVPELIASQTGTNIEQQSRRELAEDVAAARHVLTCPAVDRLVRATREPLTLGRVVDNFRDAVRLNALRIPSDPADAEEALC